MVSEGNGFALTFFKESDTNLTGNSDSKSLVPVTKAFENTLFDSCTLDPSSASRAGIGTTLFNELVDTEPQQTFATIINLDKIARTGTASLHYHETDLGLGLISMKVEGSATFFTDNDGNIKSFTIAKGGTVQVKLREGKPKNHVTLTCINRDPATVNITKS